MSTRKRVAALWLNAARVSFKLTMSDTQRSDYYEWLCARARDQYVPRPYSGQLTIFSSAGNSEWQRLCWEPLVQGGLTVLEIRARHHEMIWQPHSKRLAENVDECLALGAASKPVCHSSKVSHFTDLASAKRFSQTT